MQGPAFSSVTGTAWPSGRNTCVIPIFLPRIPGLISFSLYVRWREPGRSRSPVPCPPSPVPGVGLLVFLAKRLDLDIYARRKIQLHERVHGLLGRLQDVKQPLVRPDFELLARL